VTVQLILVRHAQPNREHNPDGPADPGLSDLGQWQAARLGEWLKHEPIDYIVTSPKRRAIETVGALIDDGHPHEIIDALNELDSRAQWYYPTEELHLAGEYWDAIQRQDWDSIGWDSPDVFNARVTEAFADLVANHRGQHVLVSSHGGVVRRIVADVLGHDHMRLPITISYASITRVDVEPDGKRTLVSLNEHGHFGADRTSVVQPMGSRPR
jgi:2,3-bisphosphoglycerate-dependent phosphoglycerate mutase